MKKWMFSMTLVLAGLIIFAIEARAEGIKEGKWSMTIETKMDNGMDTTTTKVLRQLSNSWSKWGSGLIAFHGQTGNIMFIGSTSENTQHFFDEINEYGFDLGGAGPCVRTAMSCVGAARC